jgi:hypothetical protein
VPLTAGKSHIYDRDHEIVRRCPEAFEPEPSDEAGGPGVRTRPADAEVRRRFTRELAEIQREDRAREVDGTSAREARWWAATDALLERFRPAEDDDLEDVCDLSDFYARQALDELDAIDESWGPSAPWAS